LELFRGKIPVLCRKADKSWILKKIYKTTGILQNPTTSKSLFLGNAKSEIENLQMTLDSRSISRSSSSLPALSETGMKNGSFPLKI